MNLETWTEENIETKMFDVFKKKSNLTNLFRSNLVAFCLSRLKNQKTRDKPDNDRAPPAAALAAITVVGEGEAVETSSLYYLTFWTQNT